MYIVPDNVIKVTLERSWKFSGVVSGFAILSVYRPTNQSSAWTLSPKQTQLNLDTESKSNTVLEQVDNADTSQIWLVQSTEWEVLGH